MVHAASPGDRQVKFFVLGLRAQTNAGTKLLIVEKASGKIWSDFTAVSTSPSKHLPFC